MSIKELIENPWISAIIVLITQIMFLYLRTINVIYTTERKLWPTILSNTGVSISWLLSVGISTNSMITGEWQPILAFLIGGAVGSYLGIKKETHKKQNNKKYV